jgi:hypothetical protein
MSQVNDNPTIRLDDLPGDRCTNAINLLVICD